MIHIILQIYQLFVLKLSLKHTLVIAAFICQIQYLHAENFSRIDSLSIQTPDEAARTIKELVAYCKGKTLNDFERVRFYFVWIATHIQYGENTFGLESQNPESVFSNKTAICSGYSRLFAHFCKESGIPAFYVAGYGKELNDVSSIQIHAWNIVRINDKWYPFDVTWASNDLDENTSHGILPKIEDWFMTSAEGFQATHLPFDPAYQLSVNLVTRSEFFNSPSKSSFYTEGGQFSPLKMPFTEILNSEITLDSLERAWQSFRRAFDFMPNDSAVAVKLAKTQDKKVKQTFEMLYQFNKNDFQHIRQFSIETLKNWQSKLKMLEKPAEDALMLHNELFFLPLSEDNKRVVKQNHQFYEELVRFAEKAVVAIENEIASRNEGSKSVNAQKY